MNRQERRRMGIKKKDPMISIKQSDIDAMKKEATEKGCKLAFNFDACTSFDGYPR